MIEDYIIVYYYHIELTNIQISLAHNELYMYS